MSTTSGSRTPSFSAISRGSGSRPSRSSSRFARESWKKSLRSARLEPTRTMRMLSIRYFRMYARIQYDAYDESFTPRCGSKRFTRLQQADVALLDQVEQVRPDAAVLDRDLHDQAQVREHELLRGVGIAVTRTRARPARAPPRARAAGSARPRRSSARAGRAERSEPGAEQRDAEARSSGGSDSSVVRAHAHQVPRRPRRRPVDGASAKRRRARATSSSSESMYFTSAQRSASGITAPQGAISGEPPFEAAPLVITSKRSWSVSPYLNFAFVEVARAADSASCRPGPRRRRVGPWQVSQYILKTCAPLAASAAAPSRPRRPRRGRSRPQRAEERSAEPE